jgi:organic radical activating enzyme
MLKINEIFYSIQGEGIRAGEPTVFIRFSGCNLKCKFCDTKHEESNIMGNETVMTRAFLLAPGCRWVCITGGEPFLQQEGLNELIDMLHAFNCRVQIETNASLPVSMELLRKVDHLTISPKNSFTEDYYVDYAKEIKIVVTDDTSLETLGYIGVNAKLYLQPDNNRPDMIEKIINYIKGGHDRWNVSLQLQKIINIK